MTAADRLAEIEARIEAATAGPWFVMGGHPPLDEYLIDSDSTFIASTHIDTERGKNDATFIADARTDLPATVKALRAVLELHFSRTDVFDSVPEVPWCNECSGDYPCATVVTITEALDGAR